MKDGRRRLQVDVNRETEFLLDRKALELRHSGERTDGRIGASTVAARLLEALAAQPDLIEQLLGAAAPEAAERGDEHPVPKSRSRR